MKAGNDHDTMLHPFVDPRRESRFSEDIAKRFKKFQIAPKYDLQGEELFCTCRQPDTGEIMVACDGCEEWFHLRCANVKKEFTLLISRFFCLFCEWQNKGVIQWKRKCRLEGCFEPISPESKYCGEEHGLEFMEKTLLSLEAHRDEISIANMRQVMDAVKTLDELHHIGTTFPNPSDTALYINTGETHQFPQHVQETIRNLDFAINAVMSRIREVEKRIDYLSRVRDLCKQYSEEFMGSIQDNNLTEQGKKSKQRKGRQAELCLWDKECYNNRLHILHEEGKKVELLGNVISSQLETGESFDLIHGRLCIRDRRKCMRHNGWINLMRDDAEKMLQGLQANRARLDEQKSECLRVFSIDFYEGTV